MHRARLVQARCRIVCLATQIAQIIPGAVAAFLDMLA